MVFNDKGFTLVELVVVITILGIISVFVIPRFFEKGIFDERGFLEQSRASIRYAQKLAIASGCDVRVIFTAGDPGSFNIQQWASCNPTNHATATNDLPQADPSLVNVTGPTGVVISAIDFYFDNIGRPRVVEAANPTSFIAGIQNLNIGGSSISIHPQTGYIE